MCKLGNARRNHLLASLPECVYRELLPHFELMTLHHGRALHEPGTRLEYLYFPITSVVSLVCNMENGASAETAIIGREGLVGIMSVLSGGASSNRAVVETAGYASRVRSDLLKQIFIRDETLQRMVLRHAQALMTQMAQIAICNRYHSVEHQFCCRLLMYIDRLPGNELLMTQEQIANMLGVRREGISEAAGKLQSDGIIHYRRGRIVIVNRPQLESRTCECYAVMKREYNRLLAYPVWCDSGA